MSIEADAPPPIAVRLYPVPIVADMLGMSERFVWQLIYDGKLAHVKISTRVRVRDDDLATYIDRHTRPV